ncbi:hypothetical protein COK00_23535 [Bacillus cereus]|uniref:Uncharacterized protein n=1 Tax=Bacillus cereus TaxID=1396 RepID=A0A2B4DQE3_BACCE|nr:hypothetical protein CN455_02865 [Bacillus cereus]PFB11650.1 hypothetical protein CN399_25220 [Bacillus cereus]PFC73315.1 hypothetical protein CN290_14825 [Bacillus cereus]PFD72902.1 hypothetical protein CN301_14785 [Bacillus cereus]PFP59634.1 hypothetical protein COK00_23535 [Bacillus cereus]
MKYNEKMKAHNVHFCEWIVCFFIVGFINGVEVDKVLPLWIRGTDKLYLNLSNDKHNIII